MTEQQIFISYALGDDATPPDAKGTRGFVSELVAQLEYEFRNIGPPIPKIWRDVGQIENGEQFAPKVEQAICESSIFVVVLSPNWMARSYSRKELEIFARRRSSQGESDLELQHRIIVVGKRHVDLDQRPKLLQGQVGYLFYTLSDRDSVAPEYEFFMRGQIVDAQYLKTLKALATYLWRRVNNLSRRRIEPESAPISPVTPILDASEARKRPEYWLHRAEVERKLPAGGDPLVLVSYASEDQAWVDRLNMFVELRVSELQDTDGQQYGLWNFSDAKRGTVPGDEFPEIVAEKMWRCRAALILFSIDYFRSSYCRQIELPFLMWRWEYQKIMCMPVKLGTVPIDKVKIPPYKNSSRSVILNELIDDRQAAEEFATSPHRDRNLKELKELGLEAEIEKRFDGVARRLVDFLKTRHGARDE